jgi:Xaa-Pro aminopeptidase
MRGSHGRNTAGRSRTGFQRSDAGVGCRQCSHSSDVGEATRFWQIHHVGLDSAEGLPDMFRPGQVVALEPMVSVEGLGFYLEDMLLVTAGGTEVLTTGLPDSATKSSKR